MATINDSARLTKRVVLSNITGDEGLAVTPLLSGPHGIGKTQIVHQVAKALGGKCYTIDGSVLSEGDAVGLPFASKTTNGTTEVRFTKYYVFNQLFNTEIEIFKKAATTGLMGGKIKIDMQENGEYYLTQPGLDGKPVKTLMSTPLSRVQDGEDNAYKINGLTPENRMKLIESGEIGLTIVFIDELNRTEMQTMKQLMNIILNRTVNGYDIPWWAQLVAAINPCSQNSVYATNEMDPAQTDRFLKIKVDANLNDWIDYCLSKGLNTDVVEAVAISEPIFKQVDKSLIDSGEMFPSPRSWEMCIHIYSTIHEVNNTRFFTREEKGKVKDDLRSLFIAKVGDAAARTCLENINNKANTIKPEEIFTAKAPKVDPAVMSKYKGLKAFSQKIIADNVVRWLCDNICSFEKGNLASDPKGKERYDNLCGQIKEFTTALDGPTQLVFIKKLSDIENCLASDNKPLYSKIHKHFSKEVLAVLLQFRKDLQGISDDKK